MSAVSCNLFNKKVDPVLAKVGEKTLLKSELGMRLPSELSTADSIQFVADYVKSWVKQQLLLEKAELNLTDIQKDVNRELEEYRKSLLIYRYKNAMVGQKLDTLVNTEQIETFYSDFKRLFVLQNDIVKAIYIKIPKEMAKTKKIVKMCKGHSEDRSELEQFSFQYAKKFDYFENRWTNFFEVIQNTPFTIEDKRAFLKQKKYISRTDNSYYYLLYIEDFRLKGDFSPIDFVQDRIKSLILNKRKLNFLRNLEEKVYDEGLKRSKFKIFN